MQIIAIKIENTKLGMMQLFVFAANRKCYILRKWPSQACGRVLMTLLAVQRNVLEICCTSINYE